VPHLVDQAAQVMDMANRPPRQVVIVVEDGASGGTIRAHRCGKTPDRMRSAEMRKRRSEALPKACRRAEDALPYSTLE